MKIKFVVISAVNFPIKTDCVNYPAKTDCVLLATFSTNKNKPFEVTVAGFAPFKKELTLPPVG